MKCTYELKPNRIEILRIMEKVGIRTQAELARKAGMDPGGISYLISGKRKGRPSTYAKIAKALGCSVMDICSVDGELPVDICSGALHSAEVQDLQDCAMEIFNNARSIVGTEPLLGSLKVTINIIPGERPHVTAVKDIYSIGIEER